MVIQVYVSHTSGNMTIKGQQEYIRRVFEAKGVNYEEIDIADPNYKDHKKFMQEALRLSDAQIIALPPQIFKEKAHRGDFESLFEAVECEYVFRYLDVPAPEWEMEYQRDNAPEPTTQVIAEHAPQVESSGPDEEREHNDEGENEEEEKKEKSEREEGKGEACSEESENESSSEEESEEEESEKEESEKEDSEKEESEKESSVEREKMNTKSKSRESLTLYNRGSKESLRAGSKESLRTSKESLSEKTGKKSLSEENVEVN